MYFVLSTHHMHYTPYNGSRTHYIILIIFTLKLFPGFRPAMYILIYKEI